MNKSVFPAPGIVYHSKLKNLTFAAQIPIFISICDLFYEVFHGGDHLHNIIHSYVSENGLCQLFGCMKPFLINCQTWWAFAVAIYLHKSIFKVTIHDRITFGKHNIYLHILCWGIPTIILIIGFIFNVYGVEGPWCGIPNPLTDILMVDMWMVLIIIILVIIYTNIIWKLHGIAKQNEDDNNIKKAMRTIGLYPVAYFIQWVAYVLYKTYVIPRTFATVLWVVICGNSGGIFNLFLYGPLLFNQIKRERQKFNEKQMEMVMPRSPTSKTETNTITSTMSSDGKSAESV